MSDVREVDWLPLDAAVERLSRGYERAFLENVGPHALEAAALAVSARRSRAKPAPVRKRPSPPVVTTEPPREVVAVPPPPDVALAPPLPEECPAVADDVETSTDPVEAAIPVQAAEADPAPPAVEGEACDSDAAAISERQPRSLVQMVRNWLRRAA